MFPALYHAHHSLHNEDLPFWKALAQHTPGPVLEAGCGTGRVLMELSTTGGQVVGLDLDFGMLQFLRQSQPHGLPANVSVFQADFTAFRLEAGFGLILLACNTYSTLTSDQRQRLLRRAREHLQPGGVFAVSQPNPRLLRQLPRSSEAEVEEIFPHPLDGEPVQVSSEWRRNRPGLTIQWHYDHLLPDGGVERVSALVTHNLIAAEEYAREIRAAGFSDPRMIGNYDGARYSPASPYLIMLASPKTKNPPDRGC